MDPQKLDVIRTAKLAFTNANEVRKQDIILKLSVVLNIKLDEVKKIWESE